MRNIILSVIAAMSAMLAVSCQKGDGEADYGNSLIYIPQATVSAGIDSGDMVIIREQADAREGDIVASLINHNSSTLKRLCRDEQGLYLWAENDSWDDKSRFYGREFEVQGVAVKVVKDIG